jgi:hypothetical protein
VFDILGILLIAGSFAGVTVHGTMRYMSAKKRKED